MPSTPSQERTEARLKLFVSKYLETGRLDLSAQAAGHKGKPVSLSVSGSRLLKLAKERGLIDKARERVLAKVERSTDDWARRLWAQVEGEEAERTESWKDEQTGRFHTRKFKPQEALKALAPLYAPKDAQPQGVQVNVLNVLPPQLASQVYRALLNGQNGNGNGTHA